MLDNRSGVLYASGAIALAILLRQFPSPCPIDALEDKAFSIAVPPWGTATNLAIQQRPIGVLFSATDTNGRHRVVKNVEIPVSGRYRISVETENSGSQHFMIEAGGGSGQGYGFIIVNPKTGEIVEKSGDIANAGAEPVLGRQGWYRWWVDMDYIAGQAAFDFAVLTGDNNPQFVGTDTCKVIVANPTFTAVHG